MSGASVAFILGALFAGAAPKAALTPCMLEAVGGAARARAQCGEVRVPEDRASPEGKQIAVGFAVLPARSPTPEGDPVVYLAGGPGQSSTRQAPLIGRVLSGLRQKRALVFFDARGTGRSSAIECKDVRPLPERMKTALLEVDALRDACLRDAALSPRFITTEQIARDLDVVRETLGAQQLTLIGGSYGTRLALTYDALFPGRVRAMVLDGVAPASMHIGEGMTEDNVAALTAADARCAANKACAAGGRGLTEIVRALKDRPAQDVEIPHPMTGVATVVPVDGEAITAVVRLLLYAEEGTAVLPPLLRAVDKADLRPVAAQILMAEKSVDEVNPAMQMAVLCAEDVPFYATAPTTDGPLPDARAELGAICERWPHATVDKAIHEPRLSQTPALLLSGTNDPVTPPARAEEARKVLPNSVHLVAAGLGHGVFFRGCMPAVLEAFILDPRPEALDGACAKRLGPFPLFVDGMGP